MAVKIIVVEETKANEDMKKKLLAAVREALDNKKLKIEYPPKKKPALTGTEVPMFISVTTAGKYTAAAVSETEIGIDGEWLGKYTAKPDGEKDEKSHIDYVALAERFFTEEEADYVRDGDSDASRFVRIWVRKEAFTKFTGKGLVDFPNFSVNDGERFYGKINGIPVKKISMNVDEPNDYCFVVVGDYEK